MPTQPDQSEEPPDPLLEAVNAHNGNVYWAIKSIARRVETNASGEITLLFIKYTVKVGNDGFKEIGKLTQLESLDATDCAITNAGSPSLVGLQHLRELILDITELGDDALTRIAKLHSLKRLSLSATRVGDLGLKEIAKLRGLESLNLSSTNITHVGLEYLKPLAHLTNLDLGENGIRDDGIIHLAAFKNLQSLTLNYNRLTDASAEWLKGFKHLKFLNLKGNLISDDLKAKLIEAMPYTTVNT
tara:strand:+ start:524 stop:1255 length:732 start_codon:yes stop_codon:yes gene_type:complete